MTRSCVASDSPRSPCSACQTYRPYLYEQRLVQAELRAQRVELCRIHRTLPEHQHHRIARDEMDQAESDNGNPEQSDQNQTETA